MLERNVMHVFTDGACSGNPGPAGAGAVLHYNGEECNLFKYLGNATSNIAELSAIKMALEIIKSESQVRIYTDSNYCIGVLSKNWKAKVNVELIRNIKTMLKNFKSIQFIKIKGRILY
jgi:ribonuclease HI